MQWQAGDKRPRPDDYSTASAYGAGAVAMAQARQPYGVGPGTRGATGATARGAGQRASGRAEGDPGRAVLGGGIRGAGGARTAGLCHDAEQDLPRAPVCGGVQSQAPGVLQSCGAACGGRCTSGHCLPAAGCGGGSGGGGGGGRRPPQQRPPPQRDNAAAAPSTAAVGGGGASGEATGVSTTAPAAAALPLGSAVESSLQPADPRRAQGASDALGAHTGVLKMRGLPFAASKQDLVEWFRHLPIAPLQPDAIHIVMGYDGRPTGMAFAEFASPQDALTAMAKHRCMMGARYVELFPSSRSEATQTATGGP